MSDKEYKRAILQLSRQLTPLEKKYGYKHKNKNIDTNLSNILRNIIYVKPNPMFYAMAWEKAFIDSPNVSEDDVSTAIKYFSKGKEFFSYLSSRPDSNILFVQLYKTKGLFEPLILIENQKYTDLDKKYPLCFPEPYSLNMELEKEINMFKDYVKANDLNDTLSRYVSNIIYDNRVLTNTLKIEISRAQFAITIMVLGNMPEYDTKIAVNKAKLIMSGMESRKPTKILTHVLCCIIYGLLQRHAKSAAQKGKAHCRGLTANIVNFISPKDENQKPYSSITCRGVEVALTGK
ncbi:hypothetical protein [Geobacter sp. AOG2]|uniref:hypothetical protein n=1 Tax=Geobacter sp. AOG2 TaxID=1566347 RepID=UPI001CC72468|nr:hypothetical protein [Geobacter sp. AOG2]GFE60778.1 hypothetical protein AOG2_13660 [Geobacter sp. AOG2]